MENNAEYPDIKSMDISEEQAVEQIKPEGGYMIVTKPIKKEGLKDYIVYTVVTNKLNEPIYKRFSDFYALREKLLERWPGVYIPNIPHKKIVVLYIKLE
jgi:hypothetical protein